ncbi:MAG: translation-associated GTPase [Candidatus Bathyarchaeota archaeon B23]|nr:MAG: translation-associated GTPase [Candidatus Bathyarchaeota archaeon B23]
MGLVGKPNVGKSTFFSAATLKIVEIAEYPFTTIEANRGVAYLRTPCVCRELGVQDNPVNSLCIDGVRLLPVELIDCPGLIRGAHRGRGLGNRFLDEVRRADALIVLCDAAGMTDGDGRPVPPGSHDPLDDVRMFEEEFDLWLLGLLRRDWERMAKRAESAREEISGHLEVRLSGLKITREHILEAVDRLGLDPYKARNWRDEELLNFAGELRRISKPLIVAANKADRDEAVENMERLREAGYRVVPTSAEAELALRRAAQAEVVRYTPGDTDFEITEPDRLTGRQRRALEMIRERVLRRWGSTGVQQTLNDAFFQLLDMIPVYPVEDAERYTDHQGRVLPDCYLVRRGTTAKEFAALIHTELAESFIYAVDARTKRRLGEDYLLQGGDVIKIVAAKARRA